MRSTIKYTSLTLISWLGFWASASPADVMARTMAPKYVADPTPRSVAQRNNSYLVNGNSGMLNDDNFSQSARANNGVSTNNYRQSIPTETPNEVDIQSVIAISQTLANELKELRAQSQNEQPKAVKSNEPSRDATKTDVLADVAFAEAATSRQSSSIAREKGLAFIPVLRTIEMRLLTCVDTEQGGKFKALVTTDVWDAGFANVGIPAGTLARGFIDSAKGDGDTRVQMTITEFVLPSGDLIQLRIADAVTDAIGTSGPRGRVDHKWPIRLGSTVVCGVLATAASLGGKRSAYNNNDFNLGNAIRQNLIGELGEQGKRSYERGMAIMPTIELREGANIAMILGSSIYLVPWERLRTTIPAPNKRLVR